MGQLSGHWRVASRGVAIGIRSTLLNSLVFGSAAAANAQASADVAEPAQAFDNEIIVTARKRDETDISVPVAITAVSQAELERYGTRELSTIANQIPGLAIQPVPGGGGGSVALRRIATTPSNPSADQAVSFNMDSVQLGSANIIRLGRIDMARIEVFKGPQALFFGKNSPGGIVSIRTADPGSRTEVFGIFDHEIEARETRGQEHR